MSTNTKGAIVDVATVATATVATVDVATPVLKNTPWYKYETETNMRLQQKINHSYVIGWTESNPGHRGTDEE